MFKSKRFVAFGISVVLFLILCLTTTYSPLELAGGVSVIAGIYISAESIRKSTTKEL
jgi:hypothetical protein